MNAFWTTAVRHQFLASIKMLENAIHACPEDLWGHRREPHEFWYIAFHAIFWLDFYLEPSPDHYAPPEPFGREELDPAGVLPPRVYNKAELLRFLDAARDKVRRTLDGMTEDIARQPYQHYATKLSFGELLLYSLRHVQHHAGQLNLLLRQKSDIGSRWVFSGD